MLLCFHPTICSLVPGPAFVACSTNTGEDLVKLITCSYGSDRLDVWWTCGGVAHSQVNHKAVFKPVLVYSTVYKCWSLATVYTASDLLLCQAHFITAGTNSRTFELMKKCGCISWLRTFAQLWGSFLNLRNIAKSVRCQNASPLVVDRIVRALYTRICGLLGNVPLLHASTYVTARD